MSKTEKSLLHPLIHTSKSFYAFIGALLIAIAWSGYAWWTQLTHGLGVTGMRTPVGSVWGVYISNFVFFIGITHAGIAIASAIRIMKLKIYIPIARMAELITIFSLMMAGLSIVFDMGRPDRIFNVIMYFRNRLWASPLIWDVTAIATYLVLAVTYLYIEMREDLATYAEKVPKWQRKLYRLLLPLYTSWERERIERIVWWASICNFPVMVMVHTTVAWIFGLQVAQPGWYSSIMGPYYVAGAVYSGVASVLVTAAIYRRLFKWERLISPEVFRGVGNFLTAVGPIYLYFLLSEHITIRYAGPHPEFMVSQALMQQEFAWLFWFQIVGFCTASIIFFVQSVYPKAFSIGRTVFASALVVVVLWVTRFLIVVPPLTRSLLPFPIGSYTPTWVELSIVGGTFAVITFLFALFTKIFPIIPITEARRAGLVEGR